MVEAAITPAKGRKGFYAVRLASGVPLGRRVRQHRLRQLIPHQGPDRTGTLDIG